MQRLLQILQQFNFPMNYLFKYEILNNSKILTLEDTLNGALSLADEDTLIESIFNIHNTIVYDEDSEFQTKFHQSIIHWLYDMGKNIAFKSTEDFSISQVCLRYAIPEAFISYLIDTGDIKMNQALCDHDFSDHYDEHADFYNSLDFCTKCLIKSEFDLENLDENQYKISKIYKKWKKLIKR